MTTIITRRRMNNTTKNVHYNNNNYYYYFSGKRRRISVPTITKRPTTQQHKQQYYPRRIVLLVVLLSSFLLFLTYDSDSIIKVLRRKSTSTTRSLSSSSSRTNQAPPFVVLFVSSYIITTTTSSSSSSSTTRRYYYHHHQRQRRRQRRGSNHPADTSSQQYHGWFPSTFASTIKIPLSTWMAASSSSSSSSKLVLSASSPSSSSSSSSETIIIDPLSIETIAVDPSIANFILSNTTTTTSTSTTNANNKNITPIAATSSLASSSSSTAAAAAASITTTEAASTTEAANTKTIVSAHLQLTDPQLIEQQQQLQQQQSQTNESANGHKNKDKEEDGTNNNDDDDNDNDDNDSSITESTVTSNNNNNNKPTRVIVYTYHEPIDSINTNGTTKATTTIPWVGLNIPKRKFFSFLLYNNVTFGRSTTSSKILSQQHDSQITSSDSSNNNKSDKLSSSSSSSSSSSFWWKTSHRITTTAKKKEDDNMLSKGGPTTNQIINGGPTTESSKYEQFKQILQTAFVMIPNKNSEHHLPTNSNNNETKKQDDEQEQQKQQTNDDYTKSEQYEVDNEAANPIAVDPIVIDKDKVVSTITTSVEDNNNNTNDNNNESIDNKPNSDSTTKASSTKTSGSGARRSIQTTNITSSIRTSWRQLWKERRLITDRTELLAHYPSDNPTTASTTKESTTSSTTASSSVDQKQHRRGGFADLVTLYVDRILSIYEDELEQEYEDQENGSENSILQWITTNYGSNATKEMLYTNFYSTVPEQQKHALKEFLVWFRSIFPYYYDQCRHCGASYKHDRAALLAQQAASEAEEKDKHTEDSKPSKEPTNELTIGTGSNNNDALLDVNNAVIASETILLTNTEPLFVANSNNGTDDMSSDETTDDAAELANGDDSEEDEDDEDDDENDYHKTFLGYIYPNIDEVEKGKASRTELYQCHVCQKYTRFPRYNSAQYVIKNQQGRCGEYSMLLLRFLRALGHKCTTRYVVDWADHVWVEIALLSSPSSLTVSSPIGPETRKTATSINNNIAYRWVHLDPCEAAVDENLIYQGWGKKQTYIMGFYLPTVQKSNEETTKIIPNELRLIEDEIQRRNPPPVIEDVTHTYTTDDWETIQKRRHVEETKEYVNETIVAAQQLLHNKLYQLRLNYNISSPLMNDTIPINGFGNQPS